MKYTDLNPDKFYHCYEPTYKYTWYTRGKYTIADETGYFSNGGTLSNREEYKWIIREIFNDELVWIKRIYNSCTSIPKPNFTIYYEIY